jgi:excisionase family DNA binding protein
MSLSLDLPDELVETIAERAADLVAAREAPTAASPWLSVEQAAEYLAAPTSRLYRLVHMRRIPFEKEGARLLFNRVELDAWIREGGAS